MVAIGIAVAVLAVLVLICLLALVDHHRTLEQVGNRLIAMNGPRGIAYTQPSTSLERIGLPAGLDAREHLVLLFLSTTCMTCRQIVEPLAEEPSDDLWVVLHASSVAAGEKWLSDVRLSAPIVTVDHDERVFDEFGVGVTPAVLMLSKGQVLVAQSVPSYEHLKLLLSEGPPPAAVNSIEEEDSRL
jgi:hypothetical protein